MASTTIGHDNDNGDRKETVTMLRPIIHTTSDPDCYQWNSTDFENLEGLHIIWLDENITKTSDCQDTIEKLSDILNYLQIFTNAEMCIDYIKQNNMEKIFFIVSNRLRNTIKYVYDFITAAYIFCMKESDQSRDWRMQELKKIRGIFVDQQKLISKLAKDVLVIMKQTLITIFEINDTNERSTMALQEQQSSYVWWHTLLGTLVVRDPLDTTNAKLELVEECKLYYKSNKRELQKIKEFNETYSSTDAIKWYTYDSFLYRLVNKALRTQDIDIIFKFRFFLNDLYRQLYKAHINSLEHLPGKLHIYRGQRMELNEINTLKNNMNHHVSMNTFFSTTINRNIAEVFAGESDTLTESVLFEITIDTKLINIPFAVVKDSAEEEVLISIGAVFQIISVEYDSTSHLWCIRLDLTEDIDNKLKDLIKHNLPYSYDLKDSRDKSRIDMIKHMSDRTDEDHSYILQLGFFLWRMGRIDKAEFYWKLVLNSSAFSGFNWEEKIVTYMYLSMLYRTDNDTKALEYYRLAAEILLALPRHEIPYFYLAHILREIGHIYANRNQFDTALKKLKLARRFVRSTINGDKMVLYSSIDTSIGMIYYKQNLYEKALESFNEAYKLQVTNLPECHPETALTLQYIGEVYDKLKNYANSLNAYQKALQIMLICYPWNHVSTLGVHVKIASVYEKSNDLSASIQHYEKGLTIAKTLYPFNDEKLMYYNTLVGRAYSKMFYYWLHKMRDHDVAELYQKLITELTEQCPSLKSNLSLEQIDRDLRSFPSQVESANEESISTKTDVGDETKISATTTSSIETAIEKPSTTKHEELSVDSPENSKKSTKLSSDIVSMIKIIHRQPLHTLKYYSREEIIGRVLQYVAFMNGYQYRTFEIPRIKNCFLRGLLAPRYVGVSHEWTQCKFSAVVTCLSSKHQKNQFILDKYDGAAFIEPFQELMIKYLVDGGKYSDLSDIDRIRQFFELAIESRNPLFILELYTLESEFYHRISDNFNQLHPTVVNDSLGRNIADLFKHHISFKNRAYNGKAYRWMKMMYPKSDELPDFYFIGMKFMVKSLLSATKLMNENSPIVAVLNEEDASIYDDNAYKLVLCEFTLTEKNTQTSAIDIDTLSLYPDEGEILILPYTIFKITLDEKMINDQCSFVRLEEQLSPKDCQCPRCQSDIDKNVILVLPNIEHISEAEIDAIQRRHREKREIIHSIMIDDIMNP